MFNSVQEKYLHEAFEVSALVKLLSGFWELTAGSLIWSRAWPHIAGFFIELSNGTPLYLRNDIVMRSVIHFFGDMSVSTRNFIIAYLIIYGVLKIGMSIGLLRGDKWSYPTGTTIIGIFVVYQIYRVVHTHSLFLSLMISIDVVTIFLIVHEYWHKYRQRRSLSA